MGKNYSLKRTWKCPKCGGMYVDKPQNKDLHLARCKGDGNAAADAPVRVEPTTQETRRGEGKRQGGNGERSGGDFLADLGNW